MAAAKAEKLHGIRRHAPAQRPASDQRSAARRHRRRRTGLSSRLAQSGIKLSASLQSSSAQARENIEPADHQLHRTWLRGSRAMQIAPRSQKCVALATSRQFPMWIGVFGLHWAAHLPSTHIGPSAAIFLPRRSFEIGVQEAAVQRPAASFVI